MQNVLTNTCVAFLAALGKASTESERTGVLKFASITFDHKEKDIHNLEIEAGVDVTLVAHLRRTILDKEGSVKDAERLCKLLCLVYQCTDNNVADSFYNVGTTLVQYIFELLSKQTESRSELKYAERLLHRVSSVEISLQTMKHEKEILTFLLETINEGRPDLVNRALSLLAGLSNHKDSKAIVMKFPKLFDAIVDVARRSQNVESRYQALRILSELAWHVKNRALMGQKLKCINVLVAMSDSWHPNLETEAKKALQLLSIEYENKGMLVASSQGRLIPILMRSIDANRQKSLALHVLLNLISRDTYKLIGLQQDLISTLVTISTSKKDSDAIAAVAAAQSIRRLATYAQVKDRFYEDLLRAMTQMSRSIRTKTVAPWAAKAFLDQSLLVSSSFYIVRDQDSMESIAELITSPHRQVKEPALEAVVNLTEKRSNAKKLASSHYLVTKLVDIVDGEKDAILRRHAVRAILSLVSHSSSTRRIAKHLGLVPALSRYGITALDDDVELKRAALHGVLILAPLL